jgi:NAD+ kinase
MVPWKCIGMALKREAGDTKVLLERVRAILLENSMEVVLDSIAAEQLGGTTGLALDEIAARAEVLIALGGDGTVLATTRAIGSRRVPILGVNLGHLGFLADVNPDEVDEALQAVFRGSYTITERSRLEVTQLRETGEEVVGLVLNDAILATGGDVARMIELETRVDGHLVSRYLADGLILSTPTGSTAYNLSAGGPLLDTTVSATILTPICPHALSQRPLVLSDELGIEIRLRSDEDVHLTLDGQVGKLLRPGEGIRVCRSEYPALFLTIPGHSRFETLRSKLGWGSE